MCIWPRLAKNKKYIPNKKNGGIVPAILDNRVLAVAIGCGKCIECMKKKTREWQVRLQEDIREYKNAKFVTLTFSNEKYKELCEHEKINKLKGYEHDNALAKLAVRLYLERHRKKYKKSIRHWLITELGHKGTEHIHLHGFIWTDEQEEIQKEWQYGFVWIGKYVNERTINYVTKYIHKIDKEHKYYKPKILTSAGIGGSYTKRKDAEFNKYKENNTRETWKSRQGIDIALPIYLRNKIYTEEEREKLWIEKLNKKERWVLGHKIDISENEEEYYRALKYAQKKNQRLGYGDLEKDWSKIKYENDRRTLKQTEKKENIKDKLQSGALIELQRQQTYGYNGITPNNDFTMTENDIKNRNEMREWRKVLKE